MGLAAVSNIGFASEEKPRRLHLVSPGTLNVLRPTRTFRVF